MEEEITYNISGIYRITCLKSNRFYIGSAIDIKKRITSHLSDLRLQKHSNKYLQRIYNKYGKENLLFSIENKCPPEYRIQLEQKCIDSLKPNLNLNLIASLPPSQKGKKQIYTKERIEKIKKYHSNRPIEHQKKLTDSYKKFLIHNFIDRYNNASKLILDFIKNSNKSVRFFCKINKLNRNTFIKFLKKYCEDNNLNYNDIIASKKMQKPKINVHFQFNYEKQKNNVIEFINSNEKYTNFCKNRNINRHNFKKYLFKYCEENNLELNEKMTIDIIKIINEEFENLVSEKVYKDSGLGRWFNNSWVDVSRKDDSGKHPECGASAEDSSRGKSGKRAYPKCRPKAKADSMTDKEKKNATARKRKAVSKSKGKKPVFVD